MYFIIRLLFNLVRSVLLHCLNTVRGYHHSVEVPADSTQTQILPSSSSSSSSNSKLDQDLVPTISTNKQLLPSSSSSTFLEEEILEASSSRPSSSWTYAVFLSFRGEDTRLGFTSHLYRDLRRKGIATFRDTEELRRGDSIAPEIRNAIEESMFAIVILSPNYADSKWCLDELAYILECKEKRGLRVFPVFCRVEPSEIRKQTGKFGEAFVKHKKAFKNNICKVDNWSKALEEVANVSGWNAKDREEAEVVEEIAETITHLLKRRSSSRNKDLIGMDARVEKVMSCLDLESKEVLTIGIWGMGGIGKTTLANEVYQEIHNRFETSGFVRNVRLLPSPVELQKLVCESFFGDGYGDTVKKGSKWPRLSMKKVLLVLDDVDDIKQIEDLVPGMSAREGNFWGPGSRLIITTRDRRTLTLLGVPEYKIYEVEKLNDVEAYQLLCQNAFKKVNPPKEFVELSKSFLKYACGLPLAHEVLGRHLFGRNSDEWSGVLKRLDDDLDKDIFSVLQISFDALHSTDKQIFLDIACFFNGEDDARVEKILEGCGFNSPQIGINYLLDKALVKIEKGKLWMHDLLRCLGWHTVRRESCFPGNRSRLWLDDNAHKYESRIPWRVEDARNVLTKNTGTDAVEGLFLSLPEKEEIRLESADPFIPMSKLRLLKICNVNFLGVRLSYPSKNLRLLEWHECPLESLSSWFTSEMLLVELKIPNSPIRSLWDGRHIQLKALIHMDLSHCQCLTMTPDLSVAPNLETLILEGCTELSAVHYSVMRLQHLVVLNFKGCVSLEKLPQMELRSLRTFILSGCTNFIVLPRIMSDMESLAELHLDGTGIDYLDRSLEQLKGLILLNLSGCKNLRMYLESDISILTSLKFLYLSSCPMIGTRLPLEFDRLQHLEELDMCDTDIQDVPKSISSLKNLKLLCFHGCSSLRLRYLSPGLKSLRTLNLGGCNLTDAPCYLSLGSCTEWEIPYGIGNLSSLQSLDLSENMFSSIPEDISQLAELKEISLCGCENLKSLRGDPPASVRNVDIRGCTSLTDCSDKWRRLASEEGLRIRNCRRRDDQRPLMSLSVQFHEFHETPYP